MSEPTSSEPSGDMAASGARSTIRDSVSWGASLIPGLAVAALLAILSQTIANHTILPAMLLALLFGLALNTLNRNNALRAGIAFGAKPVLRMGVALLGARISFEMVADLGVPMVLLMAAGVLATIGFGLLLARLVGFKYGFGFLSAGAVAICGASAAIAIAAVLPKDSRAEDRLVFTIVGVTVLSTVAMVLYPPITALFGLDDRVAGIFLGATIHDVAQVVGAGFSISEEAGETATLVKLLRVSMLAPIVFCAALIIRALADQAPNEDGKRPPLMPGFVIVFMVLAAINSFFDVPVAITQTAATLSGWMLLVAIVAVGLKTTVADVFKVGKSAVAQISAQTLFLAFFIGLGMYGLGMFAH